MHMLCRLFSRYKPSIGINELGWVCQSFCITKTTYDVTSSHREKSRNQTRMVSSRQQGRRKQAAHTTSPPAASWRTRPDVKHQQPKPFPKEPHSGWVKGIHSIPRARAGNGQEPNTTGTLQLGARGNLGANSVNKLERDKVAAAPPATKMAWYWGKLTPNAN